MKRRVLSVTAASGVLARSRGREDLRRRASRRRPRRDWGRSPPGSRPPGAHVQQQPWGKGRQERAHAHKDLVQLQAVPVVGPAGQRAPVGTPPVIPVPPCPKGPTPRHGAGSRSGRASGLDARRRRRRSSRRRRQAEAISLASRTVTASTNGRCVEVRPSGDQTTTPLGGGIASWTAAAARSSSPSSRPSTSSTSAARGLSTTATPAVQPQPRSDGLRARPREREAARRSAGGEARECRRQAHSRARSRQV